MCVFNFEEKEQKVLKNVKKPRKGQNIQKCIYKIVRYYEKSQMTAFSYCAQQTARKSPTRLTIIRKHFQLSKWQLIHIFNIYFCSINCMFGCLIEI